jgi:ATP-dependent DNA helicase RecQ
LLNYFGETTDNYCGNCDVCLSRVELFDGTALAKKALSAVAQLDERSGTGFAIDFLRGSKSEKIRDEHKALPGYGGGKEYSKEDWKGFFHDLLRQGYLEQTTGLYPLLKLTGKSDAVLNDREKVMLTRARERIPAADASASLQRYETGLFNKLKAVRRDLAELEDVPAYIILSDATLIELATYLPHTKDEFRNISGFGEVKIERYEKHFREVVTEYCIDRKLSSRMHLKAPRIRREQDNGTKRLSLELFNHGLSISGIAERRELKAGTIETHLAFYIQCGRLSLHKVVPEEKIETIRSALEGATSLTSVKERLGDEYSYGEIRMVIAHRDFLKETAKEDGARAPNVM